MLNLAIILYLWVSEKYKSEEIYEDFLVFSMKYEMSWTEETLFLQS